MDYSKVEAQRLASKKSFLIALFIAIAVIVGGIITYILTREQEIAPLGIVLCFVGIMIIGIGFSVTQSKFNRVVDKEIKPLVLKELYGEFELNASDGIDLSRLKKYTGVFKTPDEYYSTNYFKAKYHDVDFESSDVDFVYISYSTDSKGHTTKHEDHNKGVVIIFDLERDFNMNLSLVEKSNSGKISCKRLCTNDVEFESMEFNKKFMSSTTDIHNAFYLVTPQFQLQFMECEKTFRGSFALYLLGKKVIIVMGDTVISYHHSLFKPFNDDAVKELKKSLSFPAKFIDMLKLDSEKLNNTDLH